MANFFCGHPRTTQNTYRYASRYEADGYTRTGKEMCRICTMARAKARYVPKPRPVNKRWEKPLLEVLWK